MNPTRRACLRGARPTTPTTPSTTAGGLDRINTGSPGTTNTDVIFDRPRTRRDHPRRNRHHDRQRPRQHRRHPHVGRHRLGPAPRHRGRRHQRPRPATPAHSCTGRTSAPSRSTPTNPFASSALTSQKCCTWPQPPSLPRSPRTSIPIDVSLNGGDDNFWFYNGVTAGRVDGGTGTVHVSPPRTATDASTSPPPSTRPTPARVNLPGEPPSSTESPYAGFEDRTAPSMRSGPPPSSALPAPTTIRVYAPTTTVRGTAGQRLRLRRRGVPRRAPTYAGDQGADTLVGGGGRDRLLGGRGRRQACGAAQAAHPAPRRHGQPDIAKGSTGRRHLLAPRRRRSLRTTDQPTRTAAASTQGECP